MKSTDEYRLDSHKLIFHPHRTAQWLNSETVYPLYMELSPSGTCNHRCSFCAKDYRGYLPRFLDCGIFFERLTELASLGLKSVMFAGEGEPLLHRDIAALIEHTRSVGIDAALTSNGVLLGPELALRILPCLSWLKISIDAGSAESYAAIHGTEPADYRKVFANIEAAAALLAAHRWDCTLGTQAILLPENAAEMPALAARARDAGASYLVIKPYSQHLSSSTCRYAGIDYTPYLDLQQQLEAFNTAAFKVIFRRNTFLRLQSGERDYDCCQALPFWAYVDAAGDVWGCSSYLGDDRFRYGSLYEESFQSIWNGDRRRVSLAFVAAELETDSCRLNCRMDAVNRYLWELTHPSAHVNFI